MQEAGYRVTVHAFDRNQTYPTSESYKGVRIMRYRLGETPFGGTFDTYRGIRRFQRMVIQTLLHDPPGLVYCHDADTLRVGTALKKSHLIPFVFDMHDLQHTWVRYPAPQSTLRTIASGRMKRKMLQRAKLASAIITSSAQVNDEGHRGFLQWLRHHGLDGDVVENRPMPPFSTTKQAPEKDWTVGYVGRVRDIKAFELLLSAVKLIPPHERPRLRIAGDGVAAAKVRRMMMDEVEAGVLEANITSAFVQSDLDELLSEIDVMFAMYAPLRGNILQGALPVKMFDAAAYGIPSVVNDDCLMSDVLKQEGLGQAAPWGEPTLVAEALLQCKDMCVDLNANGEREQQRWLNAMADVFELIQ
jgi:glycosyltransferase involved in cell wall biosynthesis